MSSTVKLGLVLVGVIVVAGAAFLLLGDDGTEASGGAAVVSQGGTEDAGSYDGADRVPAEETTERIESMAEEVPAASLVAADSAAPEDTRVEARMSGRVVDEAGRGVLGAEVTFLDRNQSMLMRFRVPDASEDEIERASVETDGQGRFDLAALIEEAAEDDDRPDFLRMDDMLVVTHDAFATVAHELADVIPGAQDVGTIEVATGAEIYGRIVDENGRPLDESEVSGESVESEGRGRGGFRGFNFGSGVVDAFNQVVTESDGRFRLTGLKPGAASLSARRNDRQMGFVDDLELQAGIPVDVGDVVLEPGSSIAGTVVDKRGNPVEGASIRVSSMTRIVANRAEDLPRSTISHEFRLRSETDENGWFEISGLGHGTYTVHAWGDTFPAIDRENVATGTQDLVLEIAEYGSVLLTLNSARDGSSVSDAVIDVGESSGRGGFRFGGVTPPEERVVLSGQALADHLDLPLEDVAGQYLIPSIGNDGLEVGILADGFGAQNATTPAASSGKIVPFAVTLDPESIVRGRVVDARGEPVADALVEMEKAEDGGDVFEMGGGQVRREVRRGFRIGGPELASEALTARTDRNGEFEVLGASAGTWDLSAGAAGYVDSETSPVSLTTGAVVADLEVTLQRGGSIAGTVIDADGIPLGDTRVSVSRVDEGGAGGPEAALERELASMFGGGGAERATTDADGNYQVDDLLPGSYKVTLGRAPGGMRMGGGAMFLMAGGDQPIDDTAVYVEVAADSIVQADLIKPRGATISGEVVAGGRPVEGATVQLNTASDGNNPFGRAFRGFGRGRSAETDRFGAYTFEDVDAGDYEVSTIVPGAAMSKDVEVSVVAGGSGRGDLLFGGSTLSGRVVDEDTGDGVAGVLVTASPNEDTSGGENVQMSFQIVTAGNGPGSSGMSMNLRGGSESTVRTAADGSFEVLYVEPGRYELSTAEGSHVPGSLGPLEVTDGGEYDNLLIEVARGAALQGTVYSGESGLAMAGVPVRLNGPGGTEMSTTEDDGTFHFEGLLEGGYTAEVLGSGFGSGPIATKDVELVKGETESLELTTDPEASAQDGGGGAISFQIGG